MYILYKLAYVYAIEIVGDWISDTFASFIIKKGRN